MYKALTTLVVGLAFCSSSYAVELICTQPAKTVFLAPTLQYDVAGTDRLYFHSGPSEKCINRKVFVVPGDSLVATDETEDGDWTNVSYTSKSGKDYSGWVTTQRLKFTGAIGEMSPETAAYFRNAAKSGKLGRP